MIPALERAKTILALYRAATVTGPKPGSLYKILFYVVSEVLIKTEWSDKDSF
jgi:hypothetical protein